MNTMQNTREFPMHTLTFQAANGYQETYHCWTWEQFHLTHRTMEKLGFRRISWIDRSGK